MLDQCWARVYGQCYKYLIISVRGPSLNVRMGRLQTSKDSPRVAITMVTSFDVQMVGVDIQIGKLLKKVSKNCHLCKYWIFLI